MSVTVPTGPSSALPRGVAQVGSARRSAVVVAQLCRQPHMRSRSSSITDADLLAASQTATSWSNLFALLGFPANPNARIQTALKARIATLGIETPRLTSTPGPRRRWSDQDLSAAVARARSWADVAVAIGGSSVTHQRVAQELGLDVRHLEANNFMAPPDAAPLSAEIAPEFLRDASLHLCTAWYSMRGYETFIPVAQRCEDVDVRIDGRLIKVQIKTSTSRSSGTAWRVGIGHRAGGSQRNDQCYTADEVDEFFVITLDGGMYRIPFEAVRGKIHLSLGAKYAKYRVSMFT